VSLASLGCLVDCVLESRCQNLQNTMSTVLTKAPPIRPERDRDSKTDGDDSSTSGSSIPPLGEPIPVKKFFWQKSKPYDPDAIATQVCWKIMFARASPAAGIENRSRTEVTCIG
jgi:hypothetical protein